MVDSFALQLDTFGDSRGKTPEPLGKGILNGSSRSRIRADRSRKSPLIDAATPSAYDLLSAVLYRQPAATLSVVQLIPLSECGCVRLVAAAFAAASAAAFGRTLLLDVSGNQDTDRRRDFGSVPADADPLALRRAMTPDMVRPGLHHAAANPHCLDDLNDLIGKVSRSTAGQASPFRMVVLDESVPLAREHALMLSVGCTATIPVAIAGESRLPQMRGTIRRLRAAGASLTGLVLVHAHDEIGSGRGNPGPSKC